jgi:hypothetical protein
VVEVNSLFILIKLNTPFTVSSNPQICPLSSLLASHHVQQYLSTLPCTCRKWSNLQVKRMVCRCYNMLAFAKNASHKKTDLFSLFVPSYHSKQERGWPRSLSRPAIQAAVKASISTPVTPRELASAWMCTEWDPGSNLKATSTWVAGCRARQVGKRRGS